MRRRRKHYARKEQPIEIQPIKDGFKVPNLVGESKAIDCSSIFTGGAVLVGASVVELTVGLKLKCAALFKWNVRPRQSAL